MTSAGKLFCTLYTPPLKFVSSRFLYAIRSIWGGLSSLLQEQPKEVVNPCTYEDIEADRLLVSTVTVHAGFALSDPRDPRYQRVLAHRERFGHMLHRAATSIALRSSSEGEDHIDPVLAIAKGMDVFLLEYGMSRSGYDALQKNYTQIRE
jgi:proteasome activator subunit 4